MRPRRAGPRMAATRRAARAPPRRRNSTSYPLDSWHRAQGARMVPFAGYEMPVQYEGIMAEHLWTRENAGLFDVSHMGQLLVHGRGVEIALERLLPGDFRAAQGHEAQIFAAARRGRRDHRRSDGDPPRRGFLHRRQRRHQARRHRIYGTPHWRGRASTICASRRCSRFRDRARPRCWIRSFPGVAELGFMEGGPFRAFGHPLWISRSGYTGEDGFEISVPADRRPRHGRVAGGRRTGEADRSRRAQFAAARGRAPALRPRPRPQDDAGDGGADLRNQQAPPRRRRFPRSRCAFSPSWRTDRRSCASASTSKAASRCAKARWSLDGEGNRGRQDHQRRLLAHRCSGRSPWAMSRRPWPRSAPR